MTDQTLKFIIDLLNIKVESEFSIMEIGNELNSINDPAAFIQYIKDNVNTHGLEFLTGFQKFITLAKRFRKIESDQLNALKIEKMGSMAEKLSDKVRAIDTMVLNNQAENPQWHHFKLKTGENYFNEKEIRALESIGSPLTCVRLQRKVSGRDMLSERLEAIFIERVINPQIAAPESVPNLIASLTKEIAN